MEDISIILKTDMFRNSVIIPSIDNPQTKEMLKNGDDIKNIVLKM